MENIELKVEGMHCGGCSGRLNRVLNSLDGVENAEANFETGIVKLSYNVNQVSLDTIKKSNADAGFSVK